MSPNLPPNPYAAAEPGLFEPAADVPSGNPYFDRAESTPDLEAHAPSLRTSEAQRLNRRALGFLGGIVLLLMLMAAWAFSNLSGDDAKKRPKPEAEEVRIPELPQAARTAPDAGSAEPVDAAPIDVQADAAPTALPPLPDTRESSAAYASSMPPAYAQEPAVPARAPTLMERRMGIADAGTAAPAGASMQDAYMQALMRNLQQSNAQGDGDPTAGAAPAAGPASAPRAGVRYIEHPDTLLVRGTYIRCVLETHVVTDVPGFTSCVVTEPVYSINGRSLLLPRGSKVSGQYGGGPEGPRVAVVWDRITTPNGLDVNMASPGVDGLGGAGHPGHYDAHWPSRIASALMISLISDVFKYEGARHGPRTTIATGTNVVEMPFESNTARTVQRLADQALEASAARRPTVTLNQGSVVNIYVARDIDFASVLAPR